MRIAYILEKFPSPTEYFILNEILQFEKNDIEVVLLVLRRQKQHENIPELNDIKAPIFYLPRLYFYFPIIPILNYPISIVRVLNFKNLFSISQIIKTIRYCGISQYFAEKNIRCDHIHAHFAFICVDIAYCLSKLLRINYSFTAHAQDIYTNQHKIIQHLPFTKFLLTCTEYNKNYICNLIENKLRDKIYRVYHGIYLNKWSQKAIRDIQRNQLQILTIARLVEKKGLIYLIKSIEKLIHNNIKVECVIIGEGPLQFELENFITTKKLHSFIKIIPFVPQSELRNYYVKADIFILPCIIDQKGDMDGLPNVILEAMSLGVPVISTPISAVTEVIKHKETGILVVERNEQSIAEGVKLLAEDQILRQGIINKARKEIELKFNINTSTKELVKIFRNNINNASISSNQ